MQRVGRGGLGEAVAAGGEDGLTLGSTRGQTTVGHANITYRPSQAEQLLKIISSLLRNIKGLSPEQGESEYRHLSQRALPFTIMSFLYLHCLSCWPDLYDS